MSKLLTQELQQSPASPFLVRLDQPQRRTTNIAARMPCLTYCRAASTHWLSAGTCPLDVAAIASAILLSVTPPAPTRTRQLPASIASSDKGSAPSEPATAGVTSRSKPPKEERNATA
jgi:hypothetical protein